MSNECLSEKMSSKSESDSIFHIIITEVLPQGIYHYLFGKAVDVRQSVPIMHSVL
jgi:hypothetical protein